MIRHSPPHGNATRKILATVAMTVALFALLPAEALAAEAEHEGILPVIARLFNFAILAGVLVYFLRRPIQDYLRTRSDQIRHDLVTAAEMRRVATAQLEQIQRQMAALPSELEALKTRGAEDIAAEQVRIAETAKAERERLLDQTRREIQMRLRVARRELTEHAAQLAVQVAEQRIRRTITPDDQLRLLDQYATQVAERRTGASDQPEAG
ncbi:MAG: ATP synthase F0 subunit B [Vicinamibacterales bacterium]